MAKKNQVTKSRTTKKCQCDVCGQISNAQPDTRHVFCKGMNLEILARMPGKFRGMTNPLRAAKATWKEYVEPVKAETAAA